MCNSEVFVLIHSRRPLAAVAALALGVSALAGCQAGQAARVGNERISETTVSTVAAELPRVTGQGASQSSALANLVLAGAITQAAGENGMAMSNDDVRAKLAELGMDASGLSDETLKVAAASLLNQQITASPKAAEIGERVNEILTSAEVNPRYGIDTAAGQPLPKPAWFTSQQ